MERSTETTNGPLKLALLDRNLAGNSDAAQTYKYAFGPRKVIYPISET